MCYKQFVDTQDDAPSLRAELAKLVLAEDDARAADYNAALRDVSAILARHERDRKKRSASAIAQRKSQGKKIGGDLPYGYELASDGETLQKSTYEQRVIASARKLRADYSLREVARRLKKQRLFPREFLQDISKRDEFHAAQIKRMTDDDDEEE